MFQSTLPKRVETQRVFCLQRMGLFQSTLPKRVETMLVIVFLVDTDVSIHSTQTGRDRSKSVLVIDWETFQSTLPKRVETIAGGDQENTEMFQSTLPKRVETTMPKSPTVFGVFQSTLPKRVETSGFFPLSEHADVSIHSTQTGRDPGRSA